MYKRIAFICMFLFTINCGGQVVYGKELQETLFIYNTRFYSFETIIHNPELIDFNQMEKSSVQLIYDDSNTDIIGMDPTVSTLSLDTISKLTDDNIRVLFTAQSLLVTSEIYIISAINFLNEGYLVYARCGDKNYYMTFLGNGSTEYGGFEHLKIYSQEEFIELTQPKFCKSYVFGQEVEFIPPTRMTLDTTEVGLRSLVESLGGEIYWDNDTKTITVINGNIHCTYCKDESSDKYEKIYKDGQYDGRGRSEIIDGHTIAQPELYLYFCELFNALPRVDPEKHIFYVIDDPYGI